MRYIPWKDVLLYGIVWILFPIGSAWAIATDQWPSEWDWWSAIILVVVLVAATGIYAWVIATKAEGKRIMTLMNSERESLLQWKEPRNK